MRRVLVRYKVKPDRVAENEALVRDVYEELNRVDPGGIRYGTFKLDDGVTFVHIAATDTERNPLSEIAAFQRFQEGIGDRCDEPPHVAEMAEVGSYRLRGD
jgi:hypothetical protein